MRVSRIRSAISAISCDSSRLWEAAVTAAWKCLVALDAPTPGLDVGLHQGQGVLDAVEVGLGTPRGREAGDLGLQRVAGLDDLGQPVGVRPDRVDDPRGPGRPGDDRPVTVPDRDRADHLERDEGLAEGGAADAEPGRELPLGGQLVAGLEVVLA